MRERRALMIAGVFPPSGGAGAVRLTMLVSHLAERGWIVDVIAPQDGGGWHRDASLDSRLRLNRIVRVATPLHLPRVIQTWRRAAKTVGGRTSLAERASARGLRVARTLRDALAIPDEHTGWAIAAYRAARRELRQHDYALVLTSSFPYSAHLVGLALRRAGGPPWIAEFRDPWVGHTFRTGWLRRLVDPTLERRVVERADAVSVAWPGIARGLVARYGAAVEHKVFVHTNGFTEQDESMEAEPRARGGRVDLLYVGTLDAKLTPPDALLSAIEALASDRHDLLARLRVRFLGGADLDSGTRLRAHLESHPDLEVVRVDPFVSHEDASAEMSRADVLVLLLASQAHDVIPSKVFEYLGCGRPILAVVPAGDARNLLVRCGGAVVCDPADVTALAGILGRVAVEGRLVPSSPRDVEAVARYRWPVLAAEYAAMMHALVDRDRQVRRDDA